MSKRVLKATAITVLAIVLLLALCLFVFPGAVVKGAAKALGPTLLKCPVTIESAHISLIAGRFELRGITIGNPDGFKTRHAVHIDVLRVKLNPKTLFQKKIIVQEVILDEADVVYEIGLTGSNIGKIVDNLGPSESPGAEETDGKKVQIDYVAIRGATVRLSAKLLYGAAAPIPLGTIELRDVGKDSDGLTLGQCVGLVFRVLANAATGIVSGTGRSVGHAVSSAGGVLVRGTKSLIGSHASSNAAPATVAENPSKAATK